MTKENVYEIISQDKRFSVLAEILDKTGIGSLLAQQRSAFTFFAPTDEALLNLHSSALNLLKTKEGRDLAAALLTRHLIPNAYLYADDLRKRVSITTLHGNDLIISNENNSMKLGSAHVLTPGIAASNGVVFAVDQLLPIRRNQPKPPDLDH